MATHEVTNQVPPLEGQDVFGDDRALVEAVSRYGAEHALGDLHDLGRLAGTARAQRLGDDANTFTPRLVTHDPRGARVDEVEFHPAWHELMATAVAEGLAGAPWAAAPASGAHVARAAGFVVWSQVEAGHGCPVSMTYAAVPAVRTDPVVAAVWESRLTSRVYDFGLRPASEKAGAVAGMGMTEKQGGSDVRANATAAVPTPGGPLAGGDTYRLTGHKWFCSAPMSDVFLVLAQAPGGLTCFVVPRVLDDGARNPFAIQRLKDKLGNRSNASGEVELDGSWGVRLGDEGRGVRTIINMVAATRLDCVLGSAATMRQALVRATHHSRHRRAFGAALVDQPLMRAVLADLALESEAATVLGLRLAASVDAGDTAFGRLAVALGKFWVCKRTAPMVAEALECLGGNGYVEENGLARLYREAPLNSIWEGSGNVNALDVLRALSREPASVEAVLDEIRLAAGADVGFDRTVKELETSLLTGSAQEQEAGARWTVERLAVALQASLLLRHAPAAVSDAFVRTRVLGERGATFGALPSSLDVDRIVARILP
ncbi:acyl-CoA dehydrogenase family protein [Angustibacter sp. Root456]|uniref:acyl-CoA dehydrogenase family protein n=1 Tax=Angustibacter sp. Root456 TaxID=1736539 RepID=UPI0006F7FD1A|nr:acyl-CoA dehydrogenase family protein [Angustibacter sp. Root456]KQX66763.1 DNA alkylation response protein [Angustibacter sp. Root456]